MPGWDRARRLRAYLGAAASAAIITAAVVAGLHGPTTTLGHHWPPPPARKTLFSLLVARDLGRLPARGTSAGQWCGAIGGLSAPAHCYDLQESSGDLADSAGSLALTAAGSPRYGVVTGLPVESSGSADFAGERGIAFDGSAYFSATDTPPAAASISFVFRQPPTASVSTLFDWGYFSGAGYLATENASGQLWFQATFGSPAGRYDSSLVLSRGAWHCVTVAFDGASTAAWIDGQSLVWNSPWVDYGSTTAAGNVRLGRNANFFTGALARWRIDYGVATAADHQALCGTWTQPLYASHPAYADATWTQSGGARCFRTADHGATCFPGGSAAYRWTGTRYEYTAEPDQVNRVLYSTAIDCTNWTCNGTATATGGQVAPDGSATASDITVGALSVDDLYSGSSGYSAGVSLYPRLWIKCSAGTLTVRNNYGTTIGRFTVDCTAIAGQWTLVYPGHGAVAVDYAYASNGSGGGGFNFYSASGTVTASIWAPTLTEADGWSVVPTAAAAVSTGAISFFVDNSSGKYWQTGDTVNVVDTEGANPCVVSGSTFYLLGAPGSECLGGLYSVEVTR